MSQITHTVNPTGNGRGLTRSMSPSAEATTTPDDEADVLAACYELLLQSIRRHRAARQSAPAGTPAMTHTTQGQP